MVKRPVFITEVESVYFAVRTELRRKGGYERDKIQEYRERGKKIWKEQTSVVSKGAATATSLRTGQSGAKSQ